MDWTEVLREFYRHEGIAVAGFRCPHLESCKAAADPRELSSGAEAHVGSKYGETLRVVVVSLDTGHGPADLEQRRATIQSLDQKRLNPHMRGTTLLLEHLIRANLDDGANLYEYFAMINAAKCSGADASKSKLPSAVYKNCQPFAQREISLLRPQLLVAQGNDAAAALGWPSLPGHLLERAVDGVAEPARVRGWLKAVASEYLGIFEAGGAATPVLKAPHPSARDGRWQRFARISLEPTVAMAVRLAEVL